MSRKQANEAKAKSPGTVHVSDGTKLVEVELEPVSFDPVRLASAVLACPTCKGERRVATLPAIPCPDCQGYGAFLVDPSKLPLWPGRFEAPERPKTDPATAAAPSEPAVARSANAPELNFPTVSSNVPRQKS